MEVSVSILSNSISAREIVKDLEKTNCDYIHVDIMDGKFVENKTWTFSQIKKIIGDSMIPLDVHLMVKNPKPYVDDYALLNTSIITFHYEAVNDISDMIDYIRNYGLKVGLAINPDTEVEKIYPYLKSIDQVLVMSVYPGRSGQTFIEDSLEKIRLLKEEINNQNLKTKLSVDGGINNETGLLCKQMGIDVLVSASYLHKDLVNNTMILKKL